MAEYKKNYFNLLNLVGVAIGAGAMFSVAGVFLQSMPVIATLVLTGIALISYWFLAYDNDTPVNSKAGLTLILVMLFSILGAATGLVDIIAAQLGSQPFIEPLEGNIEDHLVTNTVALVVGIGLFLLGQVMEE